MTYLKLLVLFCFIFGSFVSVNVDHLPASEQAKGKPEKILAGINIERSRISDIIKLYGKPAKVSIDPKPSNLNVVEIRHYYWSKGSMTLHVAMYGEYMGFIDVKGAPGSSQIVRTGRGLKIGDELAAVRRIYGPRFKVQNIPQLKIHNVGIQWRTQAYSLVADLDEKGKIKGLILMAPE
jgi:hypothetical protein